tara:strand:- start:366 stop:737 length:372 start_codon:yes stop_codon:yes gene_type:complete
MVTGNKMPIISQDKSFKEAIKIMSKKSLGIVVILKKNFIKGILTDGDVRRELKNNSIERDLNKFTSNYPLVVNESMPASKALTICNEKKITSLLVVSDKDQNKKNKKLIGIIHIHFLLQTGIK